ncbi:MULTISPECIES: hypothetical protein [Staphylococcus]|uniref:hypothetical protein n=1 Tax=Staphylococcus TaxID=1279 RepID=UPI0012E7D025|nr:MULTISPECIES: hypothetical protein [Staphylococcus]MDK9850171.1 hypothetical protein [Staphylococcus equorum]MDW3803010.1 hypothetical protein [Staphylococcus saprophyticus]MDW3958293.1 hypothetical protein [Staphylococcus saprophyticus]MDW4177018.1 hypothetical protein [Staphylococcus saprophyticus]WQL49222.1 hypothetical protein P3U29_13070 [Staphylococcus saprophyticus]
MIVKIENCIENFVLSIYKKEAQLFCNLLCPLDLSKLRKQLYVDAKCINVDMYVKKHYLEKLSQLVTPFYTYEYYKNGDKYIVKYYFPENKRFLKIEFNASCNNDGVEIINLDTAKIQAKI